MQSHSHIQNVYISVAQRTPTLCERMLVIETDLRLPQSRFAQTDPGVEDLLLELHSLKTHNPHLFRNVDTVEIRGLDFKDRSHALSDDNDDDFGIETVARHARDSSSRKVSATPDMSMA